MIRRIELENVRVFEGSGWSFPLAPLTVFCGTNSAGKSTIFRTLTLLRQSQGIDDNYEPLDGRLRFVGSQVDLGGYRWFVSHKNTAADFSLALEIDIQLSAAAINLLRPGTSQPPPPTEPPAADAPTMVAATARVHFVFGPPSGGSDTAPPPRLSTPLDDALPLPEAHLKCATYQILLGEQILLQFDVVPSPTSKQLAPSGYNLILPRSYFERIGGMDVLDVSEQFGLSHVTVPVFMRGIIPQTIVGRRVTKKGRRAKKIRQETSPKAEMWAFVPLPPQVSAVVFELERTLRNITYLGPLRAPAARHYLVTQDSAPGADTTGAISPHVLRSQASANVECADPCTGEKLAKRKLHTALNTWLRYIRTGERQVGADEVHDELNLAVTNAVLVEVGLKRGAADEIHALADSGFGYSQLFPILVRGLLANRGSVMIVEQPELHLHPALQVRLAEFFVDMIRAGKQVLLETHSEHIVNAIRVLAAEDDSGQLAKSATICFIDGTTARPSVHDLSIQRDGTVADWPATFFGEAASLVGRLLRAQRDLRGRSSSLDLAVKAGGK